MAEPTPGPWYSRERGIWKDSGDVQEEIATCHYAIRRDDAASDYTAALANARLVAAAPELLAALEAICNPPRWMIQRGFSHCPCCDVFYGCNHLPGCEIVAALVVIAKAKGV